MPPPPPELDGLPGGVSPVDFVEQVMTWGANNMPYRDIIAAARNLWGVRFEEECPLLNLAILLVLGTRRDKKNFSITFVSIPTPFQLPAFIAFPIVTV